MLDPQTVHKTREWYKYYYQKQGAFRNDLLRNPEVFSKLWLMMLQLSKHLDEQGLNPLWHGSLMLVAVGGGALSTYCD